MQNWLPVILSIILLPIAAVSKPTSNSTNCDASLCTWWHDSGVINTSGRVAPGAVRQSRKYLVNVKKARDTTYYDSFVYEAIPRNGNGRIYSPWDAPGSSTLDASVDDGISLEIDNGINMAWSQFEHSVDVDIKIISRDGQELGSPDDVIIRPTSEKYDISSSIDGGIIIRIPATSEGRRFSVEFKNDLYTYKSDGKNYVDNDGEEVSIEPRNALMVFASPAIPSKMIPPLNGSITKVMKPGPIFQGDWETSEILYFPPGVYWLNSNRDGQSPKYGENHIKLDPKTYWVHFAPGAYVKGAIEYTTQRDYYATGHGVLSGEHYVYQANPTTYYQAVKSDKFSLRMWSHYNLNKAGQTWYCVGPTISAPPFNTMDFYNEPEQSPPSVTVRMNDYKQVGAFFFQTDGPQMYPKSAVHDVFYHANDDAIKTYYSDVSINRLTVWKVHNDPIIQMGWSARQVSGVEINGLNIIHSRYRRSETVVPSAIIGASPFYSDGQTIDTSKSISVRIQNIRCEGLCPALLRITPLQNYENFEISDVDYVDGIQTNSIGIGRSIVPAAKGVKLGLKISNWTIKGQKVTMSNFQTDMLGQLDIDASYWGQWEID